MILLDTHVVLEALKPRGEQAVVDWLDAQLLETLYLSTFSVAELRYRVALLPTGIRREKLRSSLEDRVLPLFSSRILSFDLEAAEICAELRARAAVNDRNTGRGKGKGLSAIDGCIAGIAAAKGFTLATRDIFETSGVQVVNPWQYEGRIGEFGLPAERDEEIAAQFFDASRR